MKLIPILIIDPGHGGKDPGGGSNKLWLEKDKVLEISLYQYNRFKEMGLPVAITRENDTYLSPDERTKIVRDSGAKYCISNHINAGGGDGAEVIYSIYGNSNIANGIAASINRQGQNIRRIFTRTLPFNNKKDYYYMHRETGAVKTLIIEYGFADSELDDIEQIKNDWKDYAEAVIQEFCKLLEVEYRPIQQKVSDWAKEAWEWGQKEGINDGDGAKNLVTEEQVVTMLYRYNQKFKR